MNLLLHGFVVGLCLANQARPNAPLSDAVVKTHRNLPLHGRRANDRSLVAQPQLLVWLRCSWWMQKRHQRAHACTPAISIDASSPCGTKLGRLAQLGGREPPVDPARELNQEPQIHLATLALHRTNDVTLLAQLHEQRLVVSLPGDQGHRAIAHGITARQHSLWQRGDLVCLPVGFRVLLGQHLLAQILWHFSAGQTQVLLRFREALSGVRCFRGTAPEVGGAGAHELRAAHWRATIISAFGHTQAILAIVVVVGLASAPPPGTASAGAFIALVVGAAAAAELAPKLVVAALAPENRLRLQRCRWVHPLLL
mmetsp:Transcript_50535/g.120503  ORF Transcript_50535/g.120503 Transcript_50535/m.120503 type:complete len:311 (-) Transcript_50535:362-1294(-)